MIVIIEYITCHNSYKGVIDLHLRSREHADISN